MLKIEQTANGFDISIETKKGEMVSGKIINNEKHGWMWSQKQFETSPDITDNEFELIEDMMGAVCDVAKNFDYI